MFLECGRTNDLADVLFEPGALRAGVSSSLVRRDATRCRASFTFTLAIFRLLEIDDLVEAAFHQENRFLDRERFFHAQGGGFSVNLMTLKR